jgi:hypothetical protein
MHGLIENTKRRVKLCYGVPYPYQIWNYRQKAIFIHIPKCAGTSIITYFNRGHRPPRVHADWLTYYRADKAAFKKFYKFSFVRHPVSRFASAYHYILDGGNGDAHDLRLRDHLRKVGTDFDAFVRRVDYDTLYAIPLFRPQWSFICNECLELKVDYVGKLECLSTSMQVVFAHLGREPHCIPHMNRSSRTAVDVIFPKHLQKFYALDFELFGYT